MFSRQNGQKNSLNAAGFDGGSILKWGTKIVTFSIRKLFSPMQLLGYKENVALLNYNSHDSWKTITLLHLQGKDQLINELQLIENDHKPHPLAPLTV